MGIFPSHKNLDLNKGTDFRLRLSNSHWQTSDNKLKISSPATFTLAEGLKNPAKDEKDVGLFIPHIYFTFTYDFAGQKKMDGDWSI